METPEINAAVRTRLLRYAQVHTTSDPSAFIGGDTCLGHPSTPGQMVLLQMIADELRALGLENVAVTDTGYLYAVLPASPGCDALPPLGILAHADTTYEQPGEGVKPRVIENYDGGDISFPDDRELVLSPSTSPNLMRFVGDEIIVASGKTLLGADDKAGIAVGVTFIEYLLRRRELRHPRIVLCVSPDEETGHGMAEVDLERLPKYCLTLDGGLPETLEWECWFARQVQVKFTGVGAHPGAAKGKLVNALTAAAYFVSLLPRNESPEQTEGRQGFYYPVPRGTWTTTAAEVWVVTRDFEQSGVEARVKLVEEAIAATLAEFPGLRAETTVVHQYDNMATALLADPLLLDAVRQAIRDVGLEPVEDPIRGGTDGSKLTARGHLTPNLGVGMQNIHSLTEWIAVGAMATTVSVLAALMKRWAERAAA